MTNEEHLAMLDEAILTLSNDLYDAQAEITALKADNEYLNQAVEFLAHKLAGRQHIEGVIEE